MSEINGISRFRFELNEILERGATDDGKARVMKLIGQQWAVFIPYMEEMAKADPVLSLKMMSPELTLVDLFGYLTKKAQELVIPGCNMAGVDSSVVLNWIRDFYDHEGVVMVKERRERELKRKQAAETAKINSQKKRQKKSTSVTTKSNVSENSKEVQQTSIPTKEMPVATDCHQEHSQTTVEEKQDTDRIIPIREDSVSKSDSVKATPVEKKFSTSPIVTFTERTKKAEKQPEFHQMSLFEFLQE